MPKISPFLVTLAALYLLMSAITFLAYALDKRRAIKHQYRIPEKTLHLLELLGGWPGALLAQLLLHHKNRKPTYLLVFILIIAIHIALWFALFRFGWLA